MLVEQVNRTTRHRLVIDRRCEMFTLTRSWWLLNSWQRLKAQSTGSIPSSIMLCVQIGGNVWRCQPIRAADYSQRLSSMQLWHFQHTNISVPMQLIIFKDLSLKRHHLPSGILTLACSCDISKIKFFSTNEINPLKKWTDYIIAQVGH